MRHPAHHRLQRQVETLRQEFLQDGELPFTDVLTEEGLKEALREIKATWMDRIFTPLVTLWVFLGQVLAADHVLSRRRRPADRPSRRAGAEALQLRDRRLLPGAGAPARAVLRRHRPHGGPEAG